MYILLRGMLAHLVIEAGFEKKGNIISYSFDGDTVGWQIDAKYIESLRNTSCVVILIDINEIGL